MKVMIPFQNPRTGEIKTVKLGFSWTLFLFSGFLGLPLFLRRLYPLAALFMGIWATNFIVPRLASERADAQLMTIILTLIGIGLSIWIGRKGNEYTAKNYLEQGWTFAEPQSAFTRAAAQRWGVIVRNDVEPRLVTPHEQRLGS